MDNWLTGLKDDWLTAVSVEMKKIVNIILISLAFVLSLSAQSPSANSIKYFMVPSFEICLVFILQSRISA